MRFLEMDWDDRRRTFRVPRADSSLSVPQVYFRIVLSILGVLIAAAVGLFLTLVWFAITAA